MHKAGALKEIQGTIDRRGLGGPTIAAEISNQIIGLDWTAGFQQQLQNAPAGSRQPFATLGQHRLGPLEGTRQLRLGQAAAEVMIVTTFRSHVLELGPTSGDGKA